MPILKVVRPFRERPQSERAGTTKSFERGEPTDASMDCEAFFETVTARLDGMSDPSRTVSGRQCALDFFHPRTAARLSDSGPIAAFYRSGVV